MRKGSRRERVFEAARTRLEAGIRPTFRELGDATGMSAVGAWKHVQKLIGAGRFCVGREGFDLPELADLRSIPSDRLRGELARRGVTLDALEEPKPAWNSGRSCAANHCMEQVRRGHLMCRRHWFQLPRHLRSAIMDSWSARHMQAYQEAVEAARDHLGGFTRVVERAE